MSETTDPRDRISVLGRRAMRNECFRIREALAFEIEEMIRHYRGTYADARVKDSLTLDTVERAFRGFN